MKKGITILTLTVTILVLAIISGVVIYNSKVTLEKVNKNEFVVEILNIETAVNNYYSDFGKYPVKNSISINILDFSEHEKSQFLNETVTNDMVTLYEIDLALIGINKTIFGNDADALDKYVLSKETGKIYYLMGIEYEDDIYYTLHSNIYSEYIDSNLNNDYKRVKIEDVEFYISELEQTNKAVNIVVALSSDATIDLISATNEVNVGNITVKNDIKQAKINTTNLALNYKVTVTYTINGQQKTVTYEVKNVDSVGPDIQTTAVQKSGYTNLEITVTDSGFGVDVIKYDMASISDNVYFNNSGKVLTTNILKCTKSGTYTIYAKDKVGNITLKKVSVTVN